MKGCTDGQHPPKSQEDIQELPSQFWYPHASPPGVRTPSQGQENQDYQSHAQGNRRSPRDTRIKAHTSTAKGREETDAELLEQEVTELTKRTDTSKRMLARLRNPRSFPFLKP